MKTSFVLPGPRTNDDLSLRPLVKDVENYSLQKLSQDLWPALLVALISVPQALAYSLVVGVPPAAGILSMVLGTAIAALFSSSRHLVIGPNNATALLVQVALCAIFQRFYTGIEGASREALSLHLLAVLTALVGICQLVAAVLKLGRLTQFVSLSVVVGYVTGTALALCVGQIFPLFGIVCPDNLDTLYEKMVYWATHLQDTHVLTAVVGIGTLILLRMSRRVRSKIPGILFVLVSITAIVWLLGLSDFEDMVGRKIALVGASTIKPTFELHFFDFRFLNSLFPVAVAIAVIGMLEASAIAKSLAAKSGQRINGNQEAFALGSANTLLSFFGGLPCSGSASRSILNVENHAATRFAAFFSSVFVAAMVFLLAGAIKYVPIAALAALLLTTAIRLVDKKQIALCWKSTHSDAFVFSMTFLSCIVFSLPVAFYIGVALSIILYLRKAAVPRVVEYTYNEETDDFRPLPEEEQKIPRMIRIINVEGELFFGSVDIFQYALRAMAEDDSSTKVFILRLKHVHDVDATTALGLKQLKDYLQRGKRELVVCNIPEHVMKLLRNANLREYLGEENLIPHYDNEPHASLRRAMEQARNYCERIDRVKA